MEYWRLLRIDSGRFGYLSKFGVDDYFLDRAALDRSIIYPPSNDSFEAYVDERENGSPASLEDARAQAIGEKP